MGRKKCTKCHKEGHTSKTCPKYKSSQNTPGTSTTKELPSTSNGESASNPTGASVSCPRRLAAVFGTTSYNDNEALSQPVSSGRRCSHCRKPGHTFRGCLERLAAEYGRSSSGSSNDNVPLSELGSSTRRSRRLAAVFGSSSCNENAALTQVVTANSQQPDETVTVIQAASPMAEQVPSGSSGSWTSGDFAPLSQYNRCQVTANSQQPDETVTVNPAASPMAEQVTSGSSGSWTSGDFVPLSQWNRRQTLEAVDVDMQQDEQHMDQNHRVPDFDPEQQIPHAPVAAKCQICKRNETAIHTIDFVALGPNAQRRRYGDSATMNEYVIVCQCCQKYYNGVLNNGSNWACAWPAFFYDVLFKFKHGISPRIIRDVLPISIRNMWSNSLNDIQPQYRDIWLEESIFLDVTSALVELTELESNITMKSFKLLNKYPWPTVKCFAGCNMFIDDLFRGRLRPLPLNHYLSYLYPTINTLQADGSFFLGSRGDWATRTKELKWVSGPSLIVDHRNGLSVLICSADQHSDGRHQFVHVPRNPVLGTVPFRYDDQMSPVVVSPNIVRYGRSSNNNTSFNVLDMKVSAGGLSTFRLSPSDLGQYYDLTQEEELAQGLVLTHREDIAHHNANKPHHGASWCRKKLQVFNSSSLKPSHESYMSSLKGASYVSCADAFAFAKAYHDKHTDLHANERLPVVAAAAAEPLNSSIEESSMEIEDALPHDRSLHDEGQACARVHMHVNDGAQAPVHAGDPVNAGVVRGRGEGHEETVRVSRRYVDILQIVHPNGSRHGHDAFPIPFVVDVVGQRDPRQQWPVGSVITLLLQASIHCRALHTCMLNTYWMSKHNLAHRVIRATHLQGSVASAKCLLALEHDLIEFARLDPRHELPEQMAFAIWSILCEGNDNMEMVLFTPNDDLSDKLTSIDTRLALMVGKFVRGRQRFVDEQDGWHLLFSCTINCMPNNRYSISVSFRWNASLEWIEFVKPAQCRRLNRSQGNFAIYARDVGGQEGLPRDLVINWSGGQSQVMCAHHNKFLIRENKTVFRCCFGEGDEAAFDDEAVTPCRSEIKWRCPNDFGPFQCSAGYCIRHYKRVIRTPGVLYVSSIADRRDRQHRRVPCEDNAVAPGIRQRSEIAPAQIPDVEDNAIVFNVDEPVRVNEARGVGDRHFEPDHENLEFTLGTDHAHDDALAMYSADRRPVYISQLSNASVPGHFVLNDFLALMKKSGFSRVMNVATQRLLQHVCSVLPGESVPLIYPEGLLHPTIFWHAEANTVTGALPSIFFTELGRWFSSIGNFAKLEDHMRVRLCDTSLLTSRDYRYILFVFDILLNASMNFNSSVVVVKKGLEHVRRPGDGIGIAQRETGFKFDQLDSRAQVNRVYALMRKVSSFDFFVSFSSNDSESFGLKPIREALNEHYRFAQDDVREKALQSYSIIFTRGWERTSHYIMHWLRTSTDRPLGECTHVWGRYEFQSAGALGNRPHVHMFLKVSADEPLDTMLDRIRCRTASMFTADARTDFHSLKAAGMVDDHHDYSHLQRLCSMVQTHTCTAAGMRCQKKMDDGTTKCRVQRHPPSDQYGFEAKSHLFDEDALEVMLQLGMAEEERIPSDGWTRRRVVPHAEFVGGRYTYPANIGEVCVPTNPLLFCVVRANCNVQKTDFKFQSSYIGKYVGGEEEKAAAHFKLEKPTPGAHAHEVSVETQPLENIKITGQALKAKTKETLTKETSLTEAEWFSLRLPFVYTNVDFVHVSTMTPENRCAVERRHGESREGGGELPPVITARQHLPQWRQHTDSQRALIVQHANSMYHADKTWLFSLRSPELLCVDSLELYTCFFVRSDSAIEIRFNAELSQSPFIDGTGRIVRVRQAHLHDCLDFLISRVNDCLDEDQSGYLMQLVELFDVIAREADGERGELYHRFVDGQCTRETIIVFTPILPWQFPKFIYHLLLTLGRFPTENGLLALGNIKESFVAAKLLPAGDYRDEDVVALTRRYVYDQLRYLSLSSRRFSSAFTFVLESLRQFFRTGEYLYQTMPLATDRSIQEAADTKLDEIERGRELASIQLLKDSGFQHVLELAAERDSLDDFLTLLRRLPTQSDASYNEQIEALKLIFSAIDTLISPTHTYVRNPCLVGVPGCGKTHLLLLSQAYCINRKLRTLLVSFTADRARALAGCHIHSVFCLPVVKTGFMSNDIMAMSALSTIFANPLKLACLRRINVFVVEEISMLSSQIICVLDIILRRVRDSPVFFGGALILAGGDPWQLEPVSGSLVWDSWHMVTSFSVYQMRQYVRCSEDGDLRRLNDLMRICQLTDEELDEFSAIITARCRFQPDWDSVPSAVLRVFGKKAAVDAAIQSYLTTQRAIQRAGREFLATDEVESTGGVWRLADRNLSKRLDYVAMERSSVFLFPNAIMRLTYNNTSDEGRVPRFSQGQLVVIREMPTPECPHKIKVVLVPSGVRIFNTRNLPGDWIEFLLPHRSSLPYVFNSGLKLRRKQWPLTYFVAATAHRIIGDTCELLATQISSADSRYRIWSRQQLLVILSRVKSLDCLYFVGELQDTLTAMLDLLRPTSPTMHRIELFLSKLNLAVDVPRVVTTTFIQSGGEVPDMEMGFVYLLVSCVFPDRAYVGQTNSIRRRLDEHNCRRGGSRFTADPACRPWALYVLIYGFPGDDHDNRIHRCVFERRWIQAIDNLRERNTEAIRAAGRAIFNDFFAPGMTPGDLKWVEFGKVRRIAQP